MSPGKHAVASGLIAAGTGVLFGSPAAGAAAFVAGTLIDLDHFFDYALNRLGPFGVRKFVRLCVQYRLDRFYLLAHSFELLIPFLVLAFWPGSPVWLKGAGIGVAVHMAMDLSGNGLRLSAYFLTYRICKGFDARSFVLRLPREALDYWGSFEAYMRGRPGRRM